jgi:hypothetical protein
VAVDLGEPGWHSPSRLIENQTRVTPSRKVSITVMMESTAKTGMMLAMTGSPTLVKYAYERAQHQAELDRVTYVGAVAAAVDHDDRGVRPDRFSQRQTVMPWSQLIFSALHDERGRADAGAHFPESVGIDLVAEAGVGDGGKGGFVSPPDNVLDCLGRVGAR